MKILVDNLGDLMYTRAVVNKKEVEILSRKEKKYLPYGFYSFQGLSQYFGKEVVRNGTWKSKVV